MTAAPPDFDAMSRDEIATWLSEHDDISAWLAWAKPTSIPGTFIQVDDNDVPMPRVVTVKMPPEMVVELDELAGRDREGRSGLIRLAVQRLLDERRAEAA